jgi:hypothetical protein
VSWSWTDEECVAANAAGRILPAQRDRLVGRPRGFPYFGLAAAVATPIVALILHGFGQNDGAITVAIIGGYLAVVGFSLNAAERRQRRRLRADLEHPDVQSGLARIVPRGNGYEARDGLETIGMPYDGPALPAPGWYRMYWVARTDQGWAYRHLLSIEPDPQPEPRVSPDDIRATREAMVQAMGATPSELLANRAGVLTTKQRGSLRRGFVGRIIGVLCGLSIAYGFLWLMYYDFKESIEDPWSLRFLAFLPGLFAAGTLLAVGATLRNMRRITRALSDAAPVVRVEGPVVVRPDDDNWQVVLDQLTYTVSEPVARMFVQPGTYAFYHLPKLERLLLGEPVEPAVVDV